MAALHKGRSMAAFGSIHGWLGLICMLLPRAVRCMDGLGVRGLEFERVVVLCSVGCKAVLISHAWMCAWVGRVQSDTCLFSGCTCVVVRCSTKTRAVVSGSDLGS